MPSLPLPAPAAARGIGDGVAGRQPRGMADLLAGHRAWRSAHAPELCTTILCGAGTSGVVRGGVVL